MRRSFELARPISTIIRGAEMDPLNPLHLVSLPLSPLFFSPLSPHPLKQAPFPCLCVLLSQLPCTFFSRGFSLFCRRRISIIKKRKERRKITIVNNYYLSPPLHGCWSSFTLLTLVASSSSSPSPSPRRP